MSKKNRPMDKQFQIWNARRFLKCNGVIPDVVDIHSLLDSTLHYPENQEIITKALGIPNYDVKRFIFDL